MNGFLCDVMVCDKDGNTHCYPDLPRGHVMLREEFKNTQHVFIFYLAYGFDKLV